MKYVAHRINTIEELCELPVEYGVEIDIRDSIDGRLHLSHDPFVEGQDFEEYLKNYHHGTMILNVKSERVEWKVIDLLKKYQIEDYFFLDSSFPMIIEMSRQGERNIALRYSEFEGLDTIRNMAGKVRWIWVDCFTHLPINKDTALEMKKLGYKICLVSPELQGQTEKIDEYKALINKMEISLDAICTKEYCICRWEI